MQKYPNPAKLAHIEKSGYSVPIWTAAVGIGRATFYTLPPDARPESVTVGARRIIIEPPAAWLKRMADRGGVPIPQRKTA